jgi:hypothetical protein
MTLAAIKQDVALPEPRDLLSAAIDKRDERQRRVDAAVATIACADDLQDEAICQAELVTIQEAINSHRADAMRAFAANPGSKKPSMAIPESLIARRKACEEATQSAAAAASARKALIDELEGAKASLATAERSVNQAALPILLAEAEHVAALLQASKQQTWALANVLRGFTEIWVPTGVDGALRPVPMSPAVRAALDLQEPQCVPSMRPEAKQAAVWRAFYTALLTDSAKTWKEEALSVPRHSLQSAS